MKEREREKLVGRRVVEGMGGKVEEEWECVDYLKHVRQSYESTLTM